MQQQLDNIEKMTAENSASIAEIHDLLAGDKFGREGMLSKQTRNHQRITRLEESQKKLTWLGGLGTFALGILIAFKDEIKGFFN